MTVVLNDNNELILSRTVTGWRLILPDSNCTRRSREDDVYLSLWNFCLHDMLEDLMEVFMDDLLVFGKRIDGKFKPIYYARKTLNIAQEHYTTTEKELFAVVFSFDKFRPYLILSKTVVYTDHSALKIKGAENLAVDHLSRLENPNLGAFTEEEIVDEFPNEHLMILKAKLNDDEPWLCPDNVMRRCVAGNEILKILAHCHFGPTRRHHSASVT
ncbi:reverse transcriptase domain-containing protein [Tanacetum coccineum]